MNLWRVFGIGGAAFCTGAIASVVAGATDRVLLIGLAAAFLQGGLAAFQEIENEAGATPPPKAPLAGVMLL